MKKTTYYIIGLILIIYGIVTFLFLTSTFIKGFVDLLAFSERSQIISNIYSYGRFLITPMGLLSLIFVGIISLFYGFEKLERNTISDVILKLSFTSVVPSIIVAVPALGCLIDGTEKCVIILPYFIIFNSIVSLVSIILITILLILTRNRKIQKIALISSLALVLFIFLIVSLFSVSSYEDCNKIKQHYKQHYRRESCYHNFAISEKNVSHCKRTSLYTNICISNVAKENQDITICEEIKEQHPKELCYIDVIIIKQALDISYCEEIKTIATKDFCLEEVARLKKSSSACEKIQNPVVKNRCLQKFS